MATKTISITEEAYNIIKFRKGFNESFSEAIIRFSGKKDLSSFYGVLSKESGENLEKAIKEGRVKHKLKHQKRIAK